MISTTAGAAATEDTEYTYAPAATDSDNTDAELTWSISGEPTGMTINANSGAISWTPLEGVTTSGAVTITVSDNESPALTHTETFTVDVTAVNDVGTVSIAGTFAQGETLSAMVTDPEGLTSATITYQWQANGVDITGATGQTYQLLQVDVGKAIGVTTTYTDDAGTDESPSSPTSVTVGAGTPDNDGVSDADEQAAPNNGDGNNDGIADSVQNNVSSLPGNGGSTYITIDISDNGVGCSLIENPTLVPEASIGNGNDPFGFNYEAGMVDFTLNCASANVELYFHGLTQAPDQIRKYGFTPDSLTTRVWYQMPATIETLTIDGNTVYKASYTLNDGELGDDDAQVNGVIVDPVGAAIQAGSPATAVPTLSQWMQYLLMLLLADFRTQDVFAKEKTVIFNFF